MEKNKKAAQYLKVTIITVVAAVVILGSVLGIVYDKDRILLDTDTLKRSVSIANSLHLKVSFGEGFIVINRHGGSEGKKIEIPTLKNTKTMEKTILVNFKSLLFSDSIEIKRTESLKTAP